MWKFRSMPSGVISTAKEIKFMKLEGPKRTMVNILLDAVFELDMINNYRVARRVMELILDELDTLENLPPSSVSGRNTEGDTV